jgi:hypothetical protein
MALRRAGAVLAQASTVTHESLGAIIGIFDIFHVRWDCSPSPG